MQQTIEIVREIALKEFVMGDSIHGLHHWEQVEANGILLAQQPETDLLVVRIFSYLHDCKRQDDWEDPLHGDRSAEFVLSVRGTLLGNLHSEQVEKLWWACHWHNKGVTHLDPTIGACFDADRLELTRVGILPRVDLMSTEMGKRIATKMLHTYSSCR
jgi:uncharacterized protein